MKVIEALNRASLDESKFNGAVAEMVDSIVDQALLECRVIIQDQLKRMEIKVEKVPEKDHRTFGKPRVAGDPPR